MDLEMELAGRVAEQHRRLRPVGNRIGGTCLVSRLCHRNRKVLMHCIRSRRSFTHPSAGTLALATSLWSRRGVGACFPKPRSGAPLALELASHLPHSPETSPHVSRVGLDADIDKLHTGNTGIRRQSALSHRPFRDHARN